MPDGPAEDAAIKPQVVLDATSPVLLRPHYPSMEGLRALAASLVVVHHAVGYSRLFGGSSGVGLLATPAAVMDIGVAIFFVLSGFLIYRPFAAAHLSGAAPPSTGSFLWRRAARIVPAYWVALTVLWASGSFSLGRYWWRYYCFLQIYDAFTALGGIIPAWSLDTEVCFYLFVPVWSLLLRRVLHRGRAGRPELELASVGLLALAGYASRAVLSSSGRIWAALPGHRPVTMREVSFSWFPNNVDLFAVGMALATLAVWAAQDPHLAERLDRLAARAAWWWLAAAAIFCWFAYRVGPPEINGGYRGFYWQQRQFVFALVGACLVFPAVFGDRHQGPVRRVLQLRPVVWIGTVSYGLYLWHKNLLERIPEWLDRSVGQVPVALLIAGGLVLGSAAAALSWYLLERPLQRLARRLVRADPGRYGQPP